MNGYYPFKDYWTIKEPFIDLIQAIFLKYLACHGFLTFFMHQFLIVLLQFVHFIY